MRAVPEEEGGGSDEHTSEPPRRERKEGEDKKEKRPGDHTAVTATPLLSRRRSGKKTTRAVIHGKRKRSHVKHRLPFANAAAVALFFSFFLPSMCATPTWWQRPPVWPQRSRATKQTRVREKPNRRKRTCIQPRGSDRLDAPSLPLPLPPTLALHDRLPHRASCAPPGLTSSRAGPLPPLPFTSPRV